MPSLLRRSWIALAAATPLALAATARAQPSAADWAALAKLPDLSGVWVPDVADQRRKEREERPPWTPAAQAQIDFLVAEDRAGRPKLILDHCLPHGMPSWMLITHNALEILATPGRITMLGEGDGNRIRRIYTDGRAHPSDPDLTIHGHSIGRWDGDTLVVDTIGVIPQAYLAISEAAGIPNNGGMHIVEADLQSRRPSQAHVRPAAQRRPGRLLPRSDTGRRQGRDLQRRASYGVTA